MHGIGTLSTVLSLTYGVGMILHISLLWRHFPTDKEHILLMTAVAFGTRSLQQEKVSSMSQWKRKFWERGCPLMQNNPERPTELSTELRGAEQERPILETKRATLLL